MKVSTFLVIFIFSFAQSSLAETYNCSVNLGYKVSVDFSVNMEAAQIYTPASGLLKNCRFEILGKTDIANLKSFLDAPYSDELLAENNVIQKKIRENQSLSEDEKEFFKLATTFIEKAQKLIIGDRLLICSDSAYPLEVTWGKNIKTLDMYDEDRELLASYEATCSSHLNNPVLKQ